MKRLDELDHKGKDEGETSGENTFLSLLVLGFLEERNRPVAEQHPIDKRTLRWSEFKKYSPKRCCNMCRQSFSFSEDLNGAESNFTHHMKNAVFIIPKSALLVEGREGH